MSETPHVHTFDDEIDFSQVLTLLEEQPETPVSRAMANFFRNEAVQLAKLKAQDFPPVRNLEQFTLSTLLKAADDKLKSARDM